MTSNEIREQFIKFFQKKNHMVEPSAPLVPIEDASLLWINSGVATLKKYFDGRIIPDNPKIVLAQKSIRTNDIENVGFTARHHTFFEMLGNFSIGDYFKKEAVELAWEFLTGEEWMNFDESLLYITVHPEDKDAYDIWLNDIGLSEDRIIRIEGNFWDIGEGPCGPNSEIFYDRGEAYEFDDPAEEMYPGGENERYLEVWNLVFSEFNHNSDGSYTPLPKQNIDTGMGLERMASIVQNVPTNFDTDLFTPLLKKIEAVSGRAYGEDKNQDVAFKVISDHVRTVSFAIADGALPSNEGRGYVLRRLLRRAVRFAKELGINEAFMYTLVDTVAAIMEDFYPNVKEKGGFIKDVVKKEEERFLSTLDEGIRIYESIKADVVDSTKMISGEDAFKLYDTYGFPFELTKEYADNDGLTVDEAGFMAEMENQRARARNARKSGGSMQVQSETMFNFTEPSTFTGYHSLEEEAKLLLIVKNDEPLESYDGDEVVELVFDRTPFYAVSGGQVADAGTIRSGTSELRVEEVYKGPNKQNVHIARVVSGAVATGENYQLKVDGEKRKYIVRNHSATHLMHQALKDVVGEHANQAGSLVEPERLRFDFSHLNPLTKEEIQTIEEAVNEKIYEGLTIDIAEMPIDEAKAKGAMALFGEKYGDVVRVVDMEGYSVELCGGIHAVNTADIGLFKITSENGIGAGIRRIEAVTSKFAVQYYQQKEKQLHEVAAFLKVKEDNVTKKIDQLYKEKSELQKEIKELKSASSKEKMSNLEDVKQEIQGIELIATEVSAKNAKDLRSIMDDIKSENQDSIIALGSTSEGKVSLVVTVPKNLTDRFKAGEIMKGMAERVGGKGGGRPDMAQGGGTEPDNLTNALQFVNEYINN